MQKGRSPLFPHLRAVADSTVNTCSGEDRAVQRAVPGGAPNAWVLRCTFHNGQGGLKKLSKPGTMLREPESWEFHLHSSVTPTINQPFQFSDSSWKPQASWARVTEVTIPRGRKIQTGSRRQLQCAVTMSWDMTSLMCPLF